MTPQTTDVSPAPAPGLSPATTAAIDTLLRELQRSQAAITGARPAVPELAARYRQTLERHGELKGRPAIYPYVGSGLGRGPLVQLADGSVKWDMINGIGVSMFGHGDPDLVATALRAALSDTTMQGNLQFNGDTIAMEELLVREAARGSRLRHCFLINSGALANESALKVCFQKNAPADRVLAFRHAFAGRTMAMVQIGDSAAGRVGLPLNLAVDYVPFFDAARPEASAVEAMQTLDALLARYPGRYACFAMELLQGEGGFNIAPREFLLPLMQRCRDEGIAVWADEIQTFGRTESLYYFQQLDLGEHIDVLTIGKLSQVCACLFTADYNPQPGLLSATFLGSTVALQVGHRMITRLLEGGYYGPRGRIAQLQAAFREHAARLVADHPRWFPPAGGPPYGGLGGLMRFTPFGGDRARIMTALHGMFELGVIAFYCGHGPFHIRFLPAVGVMEPAHFDDVFPIVTAALERAASDG